MRVCIGAFCNGYPAVLPAGQFYLPVYFGEITTSELQEKTVMLTKEQVKQLALTHFSQFLSELEENGVRIVDKML